jgi:hypothetical protein
MASWEQREREMQEQAAAQEKAEIARSLDRVAEAIKRLADAYLYVNQQEDEVDEAPEGMSLSDIPEDHPSFKDGSAWGVQKVSRP